MTAATDRCRNLHEALERLPMITHPFDYDDMPNAGVYFFYEKGEVCKFGGEKPRIVMAGTHNKDNFRSRMRDHYIPDSKMNFDARKSPPHDRSIFRKNLGRAILNKEHNPYLKVWDIDFTTKKNRETMWHLRNVDEDKRVEAEVSRLLQEKFSFRFVMMGSERERKGSAGIKSGIIGTLSRCPCCCSSDSWLGRHSPIGKIRESGLWLVQHLESEGLTDLDMKRLSECIRVTERWVEEWRH